MSRTVARVQASLGIAVALIVTGWVTSRSAADVVGGRVQHADALPPPGSYQSSLGSADVPGQLVVRLRSGVTECFDRVFAGQAAATGAIAEVAALTRNLGARRVHPVRRPDASLGTLAARRARQDARRASVAGRRRARGAPSGSAGPDFAPVYVVDLPPDLDVEAVAHAYAALPAVAWAEPVRRVKAVSTPDDPYFSSTGSWGQDFDDLWGAKQIQAPAAWDTARGDGVVVAVTDTGIDPTHPDLAGNVWHNPGEIPGNGIDDDGNGYVDDVVGYDFASDDPDPFDDHGHGTHVAGTIAATGDNAEGIVGIAFGSRVMALKGLDAGGGGDSATLAAAIVYAAENGADVINASWGGTGTSQVIDDATEVAQAAGVVFVAAAGNSSADLADLPFFPASNPHVIAVSALDHLDQRAFFSNFGARIDVGAPGGGDEGGGFDPFRSILSLRSSGAGSTMTGDGRLVVGSRYLRQAGTSMAAPHVAGAAAVVRSLHPEFSPSAVRQVLRATADDVGPPGVDPDSGAGRVNLARAVQGASGLAVDLASPRGTVATDGTVTVTGTAAGPGFVSYTLETGVGAFPTSWSTLVGTTVTPVVNGQLGMWDVGSVADGAYGLRLRVQSDQGITFESQATVILDRLGITAPASNTIVRPNGPLDLRGTAGGGGFQHYRVEWRRTGPDFQPGPWRSDGIVLADGGTQRVADGVLATFDPAVIAGNTDVDFRVVVTRDGASDLAEEERHVVLDPTLRAGFPQHIAGLPQFDATARMINHPVVADLDGDGTKEILVAYGDSIFVYRHDGTSLPGWPQRLQGGVAVTPFVRRAPAVGDLDGDGSPEVIAAEVEGYPGNERGGGFGATFVWHADGTLMAGWPKVLNSSYDRDPNGPRAGSPRGNFVITDVDGDGHNDIAAVIGPSVAVMDAQGQMLPGWPQRWPLDFPCVLSDKHCFEDLLAVGDMDGDGKAEIAAITTDGENRNYRQYLVLYDWQGHIRPGFPVRINSQHYAIPVFFAWNRRLGWVNTPVMADLDGDGDLEVAVLSDKTKIRAYHHDGRKLALRPGTLKGTKNRHCIGGSMAPWVEPPTAGDLDGDGRAELLASSHTIEFSWKPAGGTRYEAKYCQPPTPGTDYITPATAPGATPLRGWPFAISYPAGDNPYGPGPVAIADVDGDGAPEVVSASGICGAWDGSSDLSHHRCFPIYALDRAARVLPGFPKATPGPGAAQGNTPAVADLDGDGLKEIVWIDFYGNLLVWSVPGTPAPEHAEWAMFRHDPAQTGVWRRPPP